MLIQVQLGFDAVVMLTWSDWHTEPRSNRYHYATRFARRWPTYFVQVNGNGNEVTFEPVDGHDIIIVRIPPSYDLALAEQLAVALRARGVSRPLVWIYNLFLAGAVERLHPAAVVFHATEDYVAKPDSVSVTQNDLSSLAIAVMAKSDLVVAVSEGVAKTHRAVSDQPILVLPNGCDFAFWQQTAAAEYVAPEGGKVALFQGGINHRLDFALLTRLSELLPDWQFWFCGKSVEGGKEWAELQARPNVLYHGFLESNAIAALAKQSLVGLIPFKESDLMRRSLPLKAYEYLACGLPVVTTQVDALVGREDLFSIAHTAEEFAAAIERLAPSRGNLEAVAKRLAAAHETSYDTRFNELLCHLERLIERRSRMRPMLNVLMLYDDGSTHVSTIREHLEAFRRHSQHRFHFLPATDFAAFVEVSGSGLNLSCYDAIALHYSVRVSVPSHLTQGVADAVAAYRGPKLLFIQDEYDKVETARGWMERLGIDAVYTNVPECSLDFVYPRDRFPKVDFISTLTGYVPEDPAIDDFVQPMADRTLRIAYRGRSLPYHYGALGQEKYRIGVDVRRLAEIHGLSVDIEVEEDKRIYGAEWYRFIGSARATLGSESGCNVFDIDGSLARLAAEHRDLSFEQFAESYLKDRDGLVRMNQISPKIFEAIRLRTALILFEGEYSGVVKPNEHYIPLRKDYSNIDEVFTRLEDISFLETMTERAYRDVIASGRYSFQNFVAGVDDYLSRRALGRRRATVVSAPIAAIYNDGDADMLLRSDGNAMLLNDIILGSKKERALVMAAGQALFAGIANGPSETGNMTVDLTQVAYTSQEGLAYRFARSLWHVLPWGLRHRIAARARAVLAPEHGQLGIGARLARRLWVILRT